MKSFLLSVRHAARSGASINPPMWPRGGGATPSQSHPRLMTLPNVLIAMPSDRGQECVPFDESDGRRRAATAEPDCDRCALGTRLVRPCQLPTIDLECDPSP